LVENPLPAWGVPPLKWKAAAIKRVLGSRLAWERIFTPPGAVG